MVDAEYTRSPPSSWAEETRKVIGYVGHGWLSGRSLARPGHDLQLGHRRGALPVRGAEAVGAGVAAADDHDVLALGGDLALDGLAERDPVGLREELHGLVDAAELTTGDREVPRRAGADREHDGVEPVPELGAGEGLADLDAVAEDGALALHLAQPAVEVLLLHLELGDAVAQQAAGLVGALVDRDRVPGAGQLLRGREAGRTGAHDRDPASGRATPAAGAGRARRPSRGRRWRPRRS